MPKRSLGEWLRYLEQIHPVEIELGLGRVRAAAQALDLLPFSPQVIMVAGTNGKGSVVYGCEAILRGSGLRTGRYTSPHLLCFNERIAVNGIAAGDAQILAAFEAIEAARGSVTLTYFEFATLAALWIFREQRVDVAVLEVGLGGRLDAINIVDANLAVITAIDLDHQHWLGDTVEKIAPEKAAIARSGRSVVLAEHHYPSTLFTTLGAIGAVPLRAGDEWSWHAGEKGLSIRLAGKGATFEVPVPSGLRAANVAAAVQASARILGDRFDPESARQALNSLTVPGRRQSLRVAERELILDVAHNPAAMQSLVDYLLTHTQTVAGGTFAALGLMADKDLASMAKSLAQGVDGACALAIPGIDRAQKPEIIWQALDNEGIAIAQADFTAEAVWQQLMDGSEPGDRLVVCGSFHSVAGIMVHLNLQLSEPAARTQTSGG